MTFDVQKIRSDFPILSREVNGKPLVYLDNGASAQKPQVVIDAITKGYAEEYANVHRGLHYLSNLATDKYESVRGVVAKFLNAGSEDEIIFNSGTTEGINMVAYGWAMPRMKAGDEIILSIMEHHANIVPWHFLREGTVVDVKAICAAAKAKVVPVLIDGSQAAVHMPVDVQDIGCDFYAITGHKLYGPSGSGAIYVTKERMAEMQPFIGGGDMIKDVPRDSVVYTDPPMKFEAGTPGIVQTIGLGVALDYMMGIGMQNIAAHETALRAYANSKLGGLNWLQVQGQSATKGAIFSFTLDGAAHAHDISTVLDKKGVAVRAGSHCAMPLMDHMGVSATCRASCGVYNTTDEIDVLVDALELCHDLFA